MQPIIVTKPNEILSIDFYGPLPTSNGGVKYLLTTIDCFSKFVVMYPIKRANTDTVIRKIFQDYIPNNGKPEKIICDHGTQFTAEKWKKKLDHEGIKIIFASIRHPQTNLVERIHRELGGFFRTFIPGKHSNWFNYVPIIQNIINETYHETTEYTPLELHTNKKPTRVWEKYFKPINMDAPHAHERKIFLAGERLKRKLTSRAKKENAKIKKHATFDQGSLVMVRTNNLSNLEKKQIAKFFHIYEGPYIVKRKIGIDTYLLQDEENKERGTFHVTHLKGYRTF